MSRPPVTRAQRMRQNIAAGVVVAGALLSVYLGSGIAGWLLGNGWHPPTPTFDLRGLAVVGKQTGHGPVGLDPAPAPLWLCLVLTVLLFIPWCRYAAASLLGPGEDPRARGLGQWSNVRRHLSPAAVRRAARFTRPDLDARARRRAPLTELGYHVGKMRSGGDLWANWEIRCRIIARTGWGKTARLLVEIARSAPGACLIGSTKADLFEQTVRAREARGPVLVVDFSERSGRYAEGFTRLHWDPVAGCEDWQLALRRARAMVAGAEDGDRTDSKDGFFRDSATDVIAGWLHAAGLARKDIRVVTHWQRNTDLAEPRDIIDKHPAAEPAARLALDKHLDPKAPRTTSSVERFILLALSPFATRDGADFACGPSVDIAGLIRDRATIYLLASDTTAAAVAPLLTMFADEFFQTARKVATVDYAEHGRRLPVPALGVLDELRLLTPIPSLPQVCYEMRAYGIGVVYALQNQAQEIELYREQAKSLAQNVQLTIVGGYDEGLVDELVAQAGPIDITTPSISGPLLSWGDVSDSTQWRDALSPADLQQLEDGHSIMRLAGVKPFYAYTRSFREDRKLRRTIGREERDVRMDVAAAQAVAGSERDAFMRAAQATYERPL